VSASGVGKGTTEVGLRVDLMHTELRFYTADGRLAHSVTHDEAMTAKLIDILQQNLVALRRLKGFV